MTYDNPNNSQQVETDQEMLRLKEALRAAEWQIEQQNKALDTIERKVVQLITLYVLIIAFFISLDIWNTKIGNLTTNIVLILLFLAAAALISSIALIFGPYEKADNNSMHFLRERNDFNTMMQILLDDYVKIYDTNTMVLRWKTKCFEVSLCIGGAAIFTVWGLLFYGLWTK